MWRSQHCLDLINFLRRCLVHGQNVHDANLHAEFACSFNIKGNLFPRIRWQPWTYMCARLLPILYLRFGNVAQNIPQVTLSLSKSPLHFRLFQQIDALIWLRFDWSVIKGANLIMHLQTGANLFLSFSVARPLDLNLCVMLIQICRFLCLWKSSWSCNPPLDLA